LIPLSKIASAVNAILPASFTDEMRKNKQIAVQSAIGKMNLVTREEVEAQEKQLLQLREKIEAMEQLVTKLQEQKPTVDKREQLS
jgi:BMFP domain-containing protein YqiC